jgi:hypothetical protein
MGTNYYVEPPPCCPTCGHRADIVHIGKSSMGWRFTFRGYPEQGLTSAKAWFAYLEGKRINDEYDRPVTLDEFKALVERKKSDGVYYSERKQLDDEGNPIAFYEFS